MNIATYQSLDMLGLTSGQFASRAIGAGLKRPAAMAVYRAGFRENRAVLDWAPLVVHPVTAQQREHDTIKFVQRHGDGLETESVVLPLAGATGRLRNTLCVSSQVGCAMGCTFCETARMGFMKNLSAAEIVGQWHAAVHVLHKPIRNIVFMGMGEPMDNLDAVIQSIRVLVDQNGPGIGPGRIAVSTVGRADGIVKLAQLARQPGFHKLRLAVSINAPNDAIRSRIMPINRATPLKSLMQAMQQWPGDDGRRILIEYVLIPGVNDAPDHADELCAYLLPLRRRCTVNVIPYNPRRDSPWPAPDEPAVRRFIDRVFANGQFVKRRQTHGRAVMAACGQLGNQSIRRRRVIEK